MREIESIPEVGTKDVDGSGRIKDPVLLSLRLIGWGKGVVV